MTSQTEITNAILYCEHLLDLYKVIEEGFKEFDKVELNGRSVIVLNHEVGRAPNGKYRGQIEIPALLNKFFALTELADPDNATAKAILAKLKVITGDDSLKVTKAVRRNSEADSKEAAHKAEAALAKLDKNSTDPKALFEAGLKILPVNPKAAKELFKKAAKVGGVPYKLRLAELYKNGSLTSNIFGNSQIKKAFNLYLEAEKEGDIADPEQLNHIGEFFLYGKGTDVNLDEALLRFKPAAERGSLNARTNLGIVNLIEKKYEEALKLLTDCMEQGSLRALYYVGCCHCLGLGVKKDEVKGWRLIQKAADEGRGDYLAIRDYAYHLKNKPGTRSSKSQEEFSEAMKRKNEFEKISIFK